MVFLLLLLLMLFLLLLMLFCCCFVPNIYIVVLVTLYVALRLILIEVEFGWVVVVVVGWVCKVIILSNPTQLS